MISETETIHKSVGTKSNSHQAMSDTPRQIIKEAPIMPIVPSVRPQVRLADEELEELENLAAIGYSAEKCAMILEQDVRLFLRDYRTPGTPVHYHYRLGSLRAQADVNLKLLENARAGNLTAVQQYQKVMEEQRIENIKQEIFNTD